MKALPIKLCLLFFIVKADFTSRRPMYSITQPLILIIFLIQLVRSYVIVERFVH